MKDLGPAKVLLGIEIQSGRAQKKLFISQSENTKTLLSRVGMEKSISVNNLMEKQPRVTSGEYSGKVVNFTYRQSIGSLMYLMIGSRMDIAYAIEKLSRHAESSQENHWEVMKHVLR